MGTWRLWESSHAQRIGAEPSGFITNLAVHKDFGTLKRAGSISENASDLHAIAFVGGRLTGRFPGMGGVADRELVRKNVWWPYGSGRDKLSPNGRFAIV
jgi:hypothetical protein